MLQVVVSSLRLVWNKILIDIISVNFPVVAGGFALLAAAGVTQTVAGAAAPALATSFAGGAAALLGKWYFYNNTHGHDTI